MDSLNINDKVAVITGGGSGIGKSIALRFARGGAEVIILEVNATAAEQTVEELKSAGHKGEYIFCDIADGFSVFAIFESIILRKNRIDILVNSAGIAHIGNIETTSSEDFSRLWSVNVSGVFNCMKAVIPYMREENAGVILNICSIAATTGIADRFAYSATKGAVLSMSLSVAKDYVDKNIRVNCISPARIHTPFIDGFIKENYQLREKEVFEQLSKAQPIGRMGHPDEVAALAIFLCSTDASFITGSDYLLDGGFTRLK